MLHRIQVPIMTYVYGTRPRTPVPAGHARECTHGWPSCYVRDGHTHWTSRFDQKWSSFLFECQCHGVKFYDLRSSGARYGTHLKLVHEPTNLQDPLNCVAAWVPRPRSSSRRTSLMLGHIAKGGSQVVKPPTVFLLSYDKVTMGCLLS